MADDAQIPTADTATPQKSNNDTDDPLIPRWVKTASAIATILVALSGGVVGIFKLVQDQNNFQRSIEDERLKVEQASAEKARADVDAVRIKADADKAIANTNKEEADLRKQTADLAYKQHQDEILRDENIEGRKEQQAEDLRLSELISKIFSPDHPVEGDLAQLSDFISKSDSRHRMAILDALAAKLAEPRSVGEVHIAFRLINAFGPDGQQLIVDSNRIARQRFDQIMTGLFWGEVRSRMPITSSDAPTILDATVPLVNDSAAALDMSTLLQKRYQMALFNEAFHARLGHLLFDQSMPNTLEFENSVISKIETFSGKPDTSSQKQLRLDAVIQAAILADSVSAISNMVKSKKVFDDAPPTLDLSNCYLAGIIWPTSTHVSNVIFRNAYVSGGDFTTAPLNLDSVQSLRNSAKGVTPINLDVEDGSRATDARYINATIDTTVKFPSVPPPFAR